MNLFASKKQIHRNADIQQSTMHILYRSTRSFTATLENKRKNVKMVLWLEDLLLQAIESNQGRVLYCPFAPIMVYTPSDRT